MKTIAVASRLPISIVYIWQSKPLEFDIEHVFDKITGKYSCERL